MPLVTLQVEDAADMQVIRLEGEIDLSNVDEVRREIFTCLSRTAATVALDLSRVRYLDRQGIFLLCVLYERLSRIRQSLHIAVPAASPVRELLAVACLPIPLHESVDVAVEPPLEA